MEREEEVYIYCEVCGQEIFWDEAGMYGTDVEVCSQECADEWEEETGQEEEQKHEG